MPGVMGFEFSAPGGGKSQRVETSAFVMMVLGDFAGNAGQKGENDPAWLMQVPVRKVDIDNIDQLWTHFSPRLQIDIEGTPVLLEPGDLDDFHPDELYRRLPIFAELRKIRSRLLDPSTSAEALQEVISSGPTEETEPSVEKPAATQAPAESSDNMFERLLGEKRAQPMPEVAATSTLNSLLDKVVGPHVVYQRDPNVDTAVDAVDKAIAETMRQILHNPDFQALEGAWRSLYNLVQESELDELLQLKVCNVSKTSLINGLPASSGSLEDSGLYQLIVGRFRRAADDDGISVLLCNYFFGGGADDVALLATLATLAEAHDAAVIAGAESELIGSHSLAQQPGANEWSKMANPFWQQLRQSPLASRIGLAMPRILGRLPYGSETDAVESFDFEEFGQAEHENFLWVNPTLACGRLLAQGFSGFGWRMRPDNFTDIGGLPAYIYQQDGEKKMLPCAELLLPERSAEAMLSLGIMPIVSFRDRDMARLLRFQSVAEPLTALEGPW